MSFIRAFFTSVKLAVALLIYFLGASVIATIFFPNSNQFFSSLFFIIPAILFALNLLCCALVRFNREIQKQGPKHFGPDILHAGILILMAGAALSGAGKISIYYELPSGESLALPDGTVLKVERIELLQYPGGRPSNYTTTIAVMKNGQPTGAHEIQVNHPLAVGGIKLYQSGYGLRKISETSNIQVTGLNAVSDPGYPIALVGLILAGFGIFLTFYQKLKELP